MRLRTCLFGVLGVCAATLNAQTQPPVFRADADAVAVNVSVKKGSNPVLGLATADFRLFDNNILQEVSAVSVDAVPINVSFVIDAQPLVFPDVDTAREALGGMAALLRPSDRFRVLTMGNAVVNAIPWRYAGMPDASAIQLVPGEVNLVTDSVFMALFHRTDPDRRHLVVALTTGSDWCSLVTGQSLAKGAERSGAVFHWISVERGKDPQSMPLHLGAHAYCRSTMNGSLNVGPFLSYAVIATGGTRRTVWYGVQRVAIEAFDEIFDDFRRSYLLHYVPRGVERTGWHRLRVEMPSKGYTVRARPGYWATADAPASPTPAR